MRTDVPCGFPRAVRETFWHGPRRRCLRTLSEPVPSGFPCAAPGSSWNARPSACLAAPTASSTLPDRRAKRTSDGVPTPRPRGPFQDDAGSTYAKPNGTVRRVTRRRPLRADRTPDRPPSEARTLRRRSPSMLWNAHVHSSHLPRLREGDLRGVWPPRRRRPPGRSGGPALPLRARAAVRTARHRARLAWRGRPARAFVTGRRR